MVLEVALGVSYLRININMKPKAESTGLKGRNRQALDSDLDNRLNGRLGRGSERRSLS